MEISDQELRALIRDRIARHVRSDSNITVDSNLAGTHASHARFTLIVGGDPDGRCVIEPAVPCTHCGYCQSFGH